ncbi:hypothetical protein pb186bvf_010666 [Paramecium bursaria]
MDIRQIKKVRSYQKVPENLKNQLLKLVIQQGIKINQAALQLNLKYATAKTISKSQTKKNEEQKEKNSLKSRILRDLRLSQNQRGDISRRNNYGRI